MCETGPPIPQAGQIDCRHQAKEELDCKLAIQARFSIIGDTQVTANRRQRTGQSSVARQPQRQS
jgi:hypothetical protein